MLQSQEAIEIIKKYQAGQRNFQELQLRRADLRGLDLRNTNFRGVDLSYANLRDVDFSGADLREAYLNEADLTGANLKNVNLEKASLIKTYLIKANCENTNFTNVYLSGAYLIKSQLKEANFSGAYLNNTKLARADLNNAYYNNKTRFDTLLDPQKLGMKPLPNPVTNIEKIEEVPENESSFVSRKITINELLTIFRHLIQISHRYLGKTMTQKYWQSSRPLFKWLEQFEMTPTGEIIFQGELETIVTPTKLQWLKVWFSNFIQSCSQIIHRYPQMLNHELIAILEPTNQSRNFDKPLTKMPAKLVKV